MNDGMFPDYLEPWLSYMITIGVIGYMIYGTMKSGENLKQSGFPIFRHIGSVHKAIAWIWLVMFLLFLCGNLSKF